jgi:hypothetical protein
MKKLKLDLNDLKVESFETSVVNKQKGTIQGYKTWTDANHTLCGDGSTCYDDTCVHHATCGGATCGNTCYEYSCNGWTNCPNEPC